MVMGGMREVVGVRVCDLMVRPAEEIERGALSGLLMYQFREQVPHHQLVNKEALQQCECK